MIVFETPIYGTIVKRYKRFLADVILDATAEMITAHVPNTGSMKTCWEPGQRVLLTYHSAPGRKYAHTLELIHNGTTWIGVNTSNPNKIIKEALISKKIAPFKEYSEIIPEYKVGTSRFDFYLPETGGCYIEVKNVTLLGPERTALFPDAVSERGQKHLRELMTLKKNGHRCAMIYTIQREDIDTFAPSKEDDPQYAQLLSEALKIGVEIYPIQCRMNEKGITLGEIVPYQL